MRCLIINHDADYRDLLVDLFGDYNPEVVRYTDFAGSMAEPYDFVVLSGGSIIIDGDELSEEKRFLRTTSKPVIAICLGLEILALAFGVTRSKFPETRKGFFDADLFGLRGRLWYWHNYYVTDLPVGFRLLRRREGFLDLIEHESRPLVGLQGHPEKSGEFGRRLRDALVERYVVGR